MIDDVNHPDDPNVPAASADSSFEELHEEDAAVEIDFETAAAEEQTSGPGVGQPEGQVADGDSEDPRVDLVDAALAADLERQITGLKAQLEERTGQYMRIAADFENYRKRTSKEKEDLEGQIKGNTIMELFPVVDNFERARSQIKPQTEAEMTIHKSYQSVYKQLVECLKRLGVSAMRTEGEEFDPNLHEAVMREPTNSHPEGTILEEFVRGYMLSDRVLRHAMVKVATAAEETDEEAVPQESGQGSEG